MLLGDRRPSLRGLPASVEHVRTQPGIPVVSEALVLNVRLGDRHGLHERLLPIHETHGEHHRMAAVLARRGPQPQLRPHPAMPRIEGRIPVPVDGLVVQHVRWIAEERHHLPPLLGSLHSGVNLLPRRQPALTALAGRLLPHAHDLHVPIGDAAGHKARRVVGLGAVEEQGDLFAVLDLDIGAGELVPLLRGHPRVLRGGDLVVPLPPRLRRGVLRVTDRLEDPPTGIQPLRVTPDRLNHVRGSLSRQRRLRRRLERVIHDTKVHVLRPLVLLLGINVALSALPRLPHPLSDRILTGPVGVEDVQHPRRGVLVALRRVALEHAVHVVAAVARVPVLRLVADHQRRPATLQRQWRGGHGLDLPRVTQPPQGQLANLDTVVQARLGRDQPREQLHRVLRLLLRDGHDLHPRVRLIPTPRPVTVPVINLDRSEARRHRHASRQRVLAPALDPLQRRRVILRLASLGQGVEPQQKPGLLSSPRPRAILAAQPHARPGQELPPQRPLRQQPATLLGPLPGRADLDRLPPQIPRRRGAVQQVLIPGDDLLLLGLPSNHQTRTSGVTRYGHAPATNATARQPAPASTAAAPRHPPNLYQGPEASTLPTGPRPAPRAHESQRSADAPRPAPSSPSW